MTCTQCVTTRDPETARAYRTPDGLARAMTPIDAIAYWANQVNLKDLPMPDPKAVLGRTCEAIFTDGIDTLQIDLSQQIACKHSRVPSGISSATSRYSGRDRS